MNNGLKHMNIANYDLVKYCIYRKFESKKLYKIHMV